MSCFHEVKYVLAYMECIYILIQFVNDKHDKMINDFRTYKITFMDTLNRKASKNMERKTVSSNTKPYICKKNY